MTVKILAFAGSVRQASFNRIVLDVAVAGAREAGAEVTVADLRDFPMPLYDADWHASQGVPDSLRALRRLAVAADGLMIASPEYNASITPLLKNTIDWLSQDVDGESGYAPFSGKVGALIGASNGAFGTIRALPHVSYILSNLGVIMLPVMAVPKIASLLGPEGSVADERTRSALMGLGGRLVKTIDKLKA